MRFRRKKRPTAAKLLLSTLKVDLLFAFSFVYTLFLSLYLHCLNTREYLSQDLIFFERSLLVMCHCLEAVTAISSNFVTLLVFLQVLLNKATGILVARSTEECYSLSNTDLPSKNLVLSIVTIFGCGHGVCNSNQILPSKSIFYEMIRRTYSVACFFFLTKLELRCLINDSLMNSLFCSGRSWFHFTVNTPSYVLVYFAESQV